MSFVADLHLHSRYAYATSSALNLDSLAHWARLKGIDVLAAADFTQPQWFQELQQSLVRGPSGLYEYDGINFVIGTEVSCVFRQGGRGRRVHLLIYFPDLETAARFTQSAGDYGNLRFDGRPTLGISARDLVHLALETSPDCLVVPAHAWTPWYGIYGSKSGFESLEEAFGDVAEQITALETGLSSDPEMNWAVPELANRAIVSFSDAHSLPRLGRELTVFQGEPSYENLRAGLQQNQVHFTVEMYPEEGKYHHDGHRKCGVNWHPETSVKTGNVCPYCERPLTLGVLHRVLELSTGKSSTGSMKDIAGRDELPEGVIQSCEGRPPFVRMVPLIDIIAAVRGRGPNTKGVMAEYARVVNKLGTEFQALHWASEDDLAINAGTDLAEAIMSARHGNIRVEPGYDGVYGKVLVAAKPESQ